MKKLVILIILAAVGLGIALIMFNQSSRQQEMVPYVATINGAPIPLDQYKIYLRTIVTTFESFGGPDIWQATIGGIPTPELAKRQALESIVFVMLTNSQTNMQLSEEESRLAAAQAQEMFNTFTPQEQELFDINTLITIREDILLHENVKQYLTQSYHADEREEVFAQMMEVIRQNAVLEHNTEVWDALDIGLDS